MNQRLPGVGHLIDTSLLDSKSSERLEIRTFGRFSVRVGGWTLSDDARRSRKLWMLFLLLLHNRDREIPTDVIVQHLWGDEELDDPRGALHNLIYRLRRLVSIIPGNQPPLVVDYGHVGYVLRLDESVWYDADEFTSLLQRAASLRQTDPVEAAGHYLEAISLYEGHYLPGRSYELWVLAASRQYRRLYTNGLREVLELLRRPALHGEIMQICERALSIEPFLDVDELHHAYMEVLASEGRGQDAIAHYQHLAGRLQKEYGRRPSELLHGMYLTIREQREHLYSETAQLDLASIRDLLLRVEEPPGAYLCDRIAFRYLLGLEARQRRGVPTGQSFLGLFTVRASEDAAPRPAILGRAMAELQDILIRCLRRGDAVTQWNGAQYLVLLPGFACDTCEDCGERICREFYHAFAGNDLLCTYEFSPVH